MKFLALVGIIVLVWLVGLFAFAERVRGLTPAEAQARIASQWPVSEKAARSDRVIENNGSLAELETACRTVWNDLFEEGDTK